MANFAGTFTSPYNSPTFKYDVSYVQTGRASGSASYRVTVTARMSTVYDYFGYTLNGTVTIGNASQTINFKGNEMWSGTGGHTFTFNLTPTGVGDGGGTINARLQVDSPNATSGEIDTGGDETVTLSVWNTAPTMSGTVTTNPSGTIAENLTSITTTWTAGSDPEGGALTYELSRELNWSGSWSVLSATATSGYVDHISAGNQGQVIRYRVRAKDSGGLYSGYIYSANITKNKFTSPTFSMGTSLAYATTSVALTIGTPSNTNGNTSFTYVLSCSQVTVYNATQTTKPTSLLVWRTGDATPASTQPYIRFSDIKTAVSDTGYKDTFNFTLTTRNAYGSSGTASDTVSINITTTPTNTLGTISTSGTYTLTVSAVNYYYYVPNRKAIVINWGDCTDPLGGAITYDVHISYDAGSTFSTLKTGLTTSTYSTTLPAVTSMKQCKFRVYARTSYGTSISSTMASSIQLHYYNPPTIIYDDVVRNQTSATVSGTIKINTSIPSTQIITSTTTPSTFYTTSGGLVTASTASTYTSADRSFTATFNIAENKSCTFNITIQENMGTACGTANVVLSTYVPVYIPMMAIRSTGVGVNAQPDGVSMLTVGGDAKLVGNNPWLTLKSSNTGANGVEQGAGISIGESGYKASASLHITYTGDGYGHIGMGVVDTVTGLPAYEALRFNYVDDTTRVMGLLGGYGGYKALTSMAIVPQLIGDYKENSTADKMIWALGSDHQTWATHWGISYEYITVADVANQHAITFRGGGLTRASISLSSGNADFAGEVQASALSGANIGVENTSNTTGYGISLYGGASTSMPTYGLAFAGTAGFGTHGGVTGDWATYFTMSVTANRGWIFRTIGTGGSGVASITGDGLACFNRTVNSGGNFVSTYAGTGTFGTATRASVNCAYISHGGHYLEMRTDGTINYSDSGSTRLYVPTGNNVKAFAHTSTYLQYTLGSGTNYGCNNFLSDMRFKKDITDTKVTNALDRILAIKHREFTWKEDNRYVELGYIAQEMGAIDDSLVMRIPQGAGAEFSEVLQIDETRLLPNITKAIQELKVIIDAQTKEIENLKLMVNNY